MIDGTKVIDFHGHVISNEWIGMRADPERMLRAMDLVGVDMACVFQGFDGTGNDTTARFVAQHPDRFIPFAFVSPVRGDRAISELIRTLDEMSFVALKLYPPSALWPLNDPHWYDIYRLVDERGLTVIFHTGPEENAQPRFIEDIAPQFPRAIFVAGHAGNFPAERTQAITAAKNHPNVYLETSSTFRTPGAIEELVDGAGAERVLYGSDQPLMDPRAQIGKIITARISDAAKRQVLGDNARRILGL